MSHKSTSTLRVLATVGVVLFGFASQQAMAHAHLKTETPAANAVVTTSPTELTLGFSEGVEPSFSKVEVNGPDSKPVKTGAFTLAEKDNTN